MAIFENFKLLKDDMIKEGWIIEAFNFEYKNTKYIVLTKLNLPKVDNYELLKIEIIKENDFENSITIPLNVNGFLKNYFDIKTFRKFFNIEYSENLGNIVNQFIVHFSSYIPNKVTLSKSNTLKKAIVNSLSKSDSQDPNKIYCYNVVRHLNNENRSVFNDNKAKLLRPELYEKLKDEPKISFCFSTKIEKHKSDSEILLNFSQRK